MKNLEEVIQAIYDEMPGFLIFELTNGAKVLVRQQYDANEDTYFQGGCLVSCCADDVYDALDMLDSGFSDEKSLMLTPDIIKSVTNIMAPDYSGDWTFAEFVEKIKEILNLDSKRYRGQSIDSYRVIKFLNHGGSIIIEGDPFEAKSNSHSQSSNQSFDFTIKSKKRKSLVL